MKKILLAKLLFASVVVYAQQTGPQTLGQLDESPAGSKILDYIETANEGNAVNEAWIRKLFSPKLINAAGMDVLKEMTENSSKTEGRLVIYEANRLGMFEYKLKVKTTESGWFDMVFTFEENDPYRIVGITMDSAEKGSSAKKPIFPNG